MKQLLIGISLLWLLSSSITLGNPLIHVHVINQLTKEVQISYYQSGIGFSGPHTAVYQTDTISPGTERSIVIANLRRYPPLLTYCVQHAHRTPCRSDYHKIDLKSEGSHSVHCTIVGENHVSISHTCPPQCPIHNPQEPANACWQD